MKRGAHCKLRLKISCACVNSAGTIKAQSKTYDCFNSINTFVRCRWLFLDLSPIGRGIWRGRAYFHRRQNAWQVNLRRSQPRLELRLAVNNLPFRRAALPLGSKRKTSMISEITIQDPTEEFLPDEDSIFTIWLDSQDDEPEVLTISNSPPPQYH